MEQESGANETQQRSGISAIGLKTEAALMSRAAEYNIKAPKIYSVTPKDSAFGEAVLMERVDGIASQKDQKKFTCGKSRDTYLDSSNRYRVV